MISGLISWRLCKRPPYRRDVHGRRSQDLIFGLRKVGLLRALRDAARLPLVSRSALLPIKTSAAIIEKMTAASFTMPTSPEVLAGSTPIQHVARALPDIIGRSAIRGTDARTKRSPQAAFPIGCELYRPFCERCPLWPLSPGATWRPDPSRFAPAALNRNFPWVSPIPRDRCAHKIPRALAGADRAGRGAGRCPLSLGKAFPCGRACGLGRPLLRGHPATPRE